jgi:hypothetical protein
MTIEHCFEVPDHVVTWLQPDRQLLECPVCGSDNGLHLGDARTHHQSSDDRDELNPLATRGPWVSIPLWCELCHRRTQLVVGFHKGTVGFATVPYIGRVIWVEEESETHYGR